MRRCAIILLIVLGIILPRSIFADTSNAFVQVNVVVPDQSSSSFQQGLQAAFTQVMLQLSNDPLISTKPVFQNAIKNIMQWVQSYGYVQQPNTAASAQTVTLLEVVFDRVALQQLLNQSVLASQQKAVPVVQNAVTASSLQLTVSGIQNMTDYENVLHALREKTGVEKVFADELSNNRVAFHVRLIENKNHFESDLAADHRFRVSVNDLQPVNAVVEKQYSWIGNQA
ncbi:MAG: hypothetical protein COY58_03590 [Gammaproteobacteria bacterium CG_4_10_14_0_8_um_filter_38_16]|nr:MAG: hypothetical protein COY58_03590 [Gammaproteobacteria bacterium CG_4_10_14_0_8_um_filter_38_16]PJA03665.1 MAG: hypothetical protein COX72_03975 [Gammaproteobacteria bacterium CG_4_10_14_0_2_um_filter_38_22]PJB11331.1 MAG: hypothetical protein CO120_00780 [Gammaproteobacteria bacterium CG_4_9_14_3_um_filter_38_9]